MKLRATAFSKNSRSIYRRFIEDRTVSALLTSLTWIVLLSVELFLRGDVSDSTQRE